MEIFLFLHLKDDIMKRGAARFLVKGTRKIAFWATGGILVQPGKLALWAALVSILLKELVFQYTNHKAKQLDSQAMCVVFKFYVNLQSNCKIA